MQRLYLISLGAFRDQEECLLRLYIPTDNACWENIVDKLGDRESNSVSRAYTWVVGGVSGWNRGAADTTG